MGNQQEIGFPEPLEETTKKETPIMAHEALVAAARQEYGIFNRPLVQQEDGKWYTTDFDGTAIEASEWNKKMDELDAPTGRKDFN